MAISLYRPHGRSQAILTDRSARWSQWVGTTGEHPWSTCRRMAEWPGAFGSLTQYLTEVVRLRYTQRLDGGRACPRSLRRLGGDSPQGDLMRAAEELGGCTGLGACCKPRPRRQAGGGLPCGSAIRGERSGAARAAVALRYDVRSRGRAPQTLIVDVARSVFTRRDAAAPPELLGAAATTCSPRSRSAVGTVGLLHGDRSSDAGPLVEFDRELVDLFAGGTGQRAGARPAEQTLQRHRRSWAPPRASWRAGWAPRRHAAPAAAPPRGRQPRQPIR